MLILGISAFYHDAAACIVRDGEIVAAAQEERFTRVKHDARFPQHAIEYCLREAGARIDDLDVVGFYEKPGAKFDRLIETFFATAPGGLVQFLSAMPIWITERLHLPRTIRKQLGEIDADIDASDDSRNGRREKYRGRLCFTEHHESHAASAFFPSPFESAAILTLDGVGEWTTASFGRGNGRNLELTGRIAFPHSLGLLYSAFTYYTGFKVNSGEYKVMGLAPYGEPRYVQTILDNLVEHKDDGSFRLNLAYFNFHRGFTMTNRRFDALFGGPPRKPESQLTQREMDLARSVQEVTEEVVLRMARHAHKAAGGDEKNLCLAGGVALNCVANGRVLREGPFERLWIQPAAGDAGGALGCALALWHRYCDAPRKVPESSTAASNGAVSRDSQRGSYLGPAFDDDAVAAFIEAVGAKATKLDREELLDRGADALASERVLGWFQGRMEFGPRALGARSILGDPRSPKMQSVMNLKIKFRESFRPFAPSVLVEHVAEWFEFEGDSPYMLLVADVKESIRIAMTDEQRALFGIDKLHVPRSSIPAVTHVDYSARLQTVDAERNPLYHALISRFRDRTGCPLVVNTSFNVRGEPIVCTPADAYACFMRTEMDALALGSYWLEKADQPEWQDDEDWRRKFKLD